MVNSEWFQILEFQTVQTLRLHKALDSGLRAISWVKMF